MGPSISSGEFGVPIAIFGKAKLPVTATSVMVALVPTIFASVAVPVAVMLPPVALPKKRLEIYALSAERRFENRLVELALVSVEIVAERFCIALLVAVRELRIASLVNEYVTLPAVSVATVRLLFGLTAKKFKRWETEVVATTPFIVDVIMPELAASIFELTAEVVETEPPIFKVITLPELLKVLGTEMLVNVALVAVRLVAARLVPVALVNSRFEMKPLSELKIELNKLVVVALAACRLVADKFVAVAFCKILF